MMKVLRLLAPALVTIALQSCDGILDGIYDKPSEDAAATVSGRLYVDASDWTQWHYIDLHALAEIGRASCRERV